MWAAISGKNNLGFLKKKTILTQGPAAKAYRLPQHFFRSLVRLKIFSDALSVETYLSFKTN